MFSHFIQALIIGTMAQYSKFKKNNLKVCFRCRAMSADLNTYCLNCHSVVYCEKKCMKKNLVLHKKLCDFYVENNSIIKSMMENMSFNYAIIEEKRSKANSIQNESL
jgi:hypothetical protein